MYKAPRQLFPGAYAKQQGHIVCAVVNTYAVYVAVSDQVNAVTNMCGIAHVISASFLSKSKVRTVVLIQAPVPE